MCLFIAAAMADPVVTGEMEDAVLRTIARLDGTPFPSTASLASRWLFGGADLETAYCAQVLAVTYQAMGLLPAVNRAGMTQAASGAGTTLGCPTGSGSAARSPGSSRPVTRAC